MSRPAAETLALDAARRGRPLPENVRLALETRRLRERQAALEKERLEAARELHQTKGTLEELGPLGRARRGRTLRDRIEEQRRAVARLDRELERLEERRRLRRERALELARTSNRPEHGLARETALEPGLERKPELGIEL